MTKKIAIQGIEGSFHHIVGTEFYKDPIEIRYCLSFDEVVHSITSGDCEEAVMAIENSIAGSIIPNYARIDHNDLNIKGEYLCVSHFFYSYCIFFDLTTVNMRNTDFL